MIVTGEHRFSSSRSSQVTGIIDGREGVCQRKNGRGVARCPSCSQNAHTQKVLVRCAQSRAASATPLGGEVGKNDKKRWDGLMIFCARGTRGRGLPSLDARSGRSISPHPWIENEQAWRDHIHGRCSSDARSKRAALVPP